MEQHQIVEISEKVPSDEEIEEQNQTTFVEEVPIIKNFISENFLRKVFQVHLIGFDTKVKDHYDF